MRKHIAVFLSILMIFSSLGVVGFAADETQQPGQTTVDKIVDSIGFEEALKNFNSDGLKIPDEYLDGNPVDIEKLLDEGALNDVNMLGLSVDFLYHSSEPLMWSSIEVNKGDLALAQANLNMYLLSLLKSRIGGEGDVKLFTSANATAITNFIGPIINPGFVPVTLKGELYNSEKGFYTGIATASGLADVIQRNWCNQVSVNFKPLLYVLGFDFNDDDMLGESRLRDGMAISKVLIKSVINRVLEVGPVDYVLNVVSNMSKTYSMYMFEPLKALLNGQLLLGNISEEELGTMKGLFNLIFNGNNPNDTEHLQFITMPTFRFAMATNANGTYSQATDTTEMFLYMMLYLNLVGKYKSNSIAVEKIKEKVATLNISDTDKSYLNIILDGFFNGDVTELVSILDDLVIKNIDTTKQGLLQSLKNFLANIYRNIAKMVEKIIDSFLHFGEF